MRLSKNLIGTKKNSPDLEALNARLLIRAGFVDQTMAGVYSFLPLGWRVLNKIENIIREEMNEIAAEVLLPALSPVDLWRKTGRLETVDVLFKALGANSSSLTRNDGEYVLNSTHEEIITPLVQKFKMSYRDLPVAMYQIQTKFRNEERPKSGLLRGREFRMKDLYSFHIDDDDRSKFYDQVLVKYKKIFDRLGIGDETIVALAGGGDFTDDFTHEFQTKCLTGEDRIYYDSDEDIYYNSEVVPDEVKQKGEYFQGSEVGNTFPLGTKFSDAFGYTYTDQNGQQKPVYMASYGIGSSRVMGVLVEKMSDERGLVWPETVAPFRAHLVNIKVSGDQIYEKLQAAGIEVLYDDREAAGPGDKLGDADLIGCPFRLVISEKSGEQIEIKRRDSDQVSLHSLNEIINKLTT